MPLCYIAMTDQHGITDLLFVSVLVSVMEQRNKSSCVIQFHCHVMLNSAQCCLNNRDKLEEFMERSTDAT